MKTIRQSIFETNSSSAHVFALKYGGKRAKDQLKLFVDNKQLINDFKYSIFRSSEEENKCSYWMTFDDFQYCSDSIITKWKEKLDFWLQAITLYVVDINKDSIVKIEEKCAHENLNSNDKLLWASNGNRVLQDIWCKLSRLLNIHPKDKSIKPEVHITDLVSLDSGFSTTPLCDDYFVLDDNGNIKDMEDVALEKIALNIIDPESTIWACIYEDDWTLDKYKKNINSDQELIENFTWIKN